jgi:inorganic triphosphatase YgiF
LAVETEAKFTVPDEETFARLQSVERLGPYVGRPGTIKKIRDRYLDTDARSFYSRQFAARLRENTKSGELLLTLKRMGPQAQGPIHTRDEYETVVPSPDIADWPEGEVRRLVEEIARGQPLRDLVTVDQTRTVSYLYQGERRVAEMSLDEVDMQTSIEPVLSYELEVEMLPEGDISDLRIISRVLTEEYGLVPQPLSKFERALALSYLESP